MHSVILALPYRVHIVSLYNCRQKRVTVLVYSIIRYLRYTKRAIAIYQYCEHRNCSSLFTIIILYFLCCRSQLMFSHTCVFLSFSPGAGHAMAHIAARHCLSTMPTPTFPSFAPQRKTPLLLIQQRSVV